MTHVTASAAPSAYVTRAQAAIIGGKNHILLEALAGTGKTTFICGSTRILPAGSSVLVLAFNKHVQVELESRQRKGLVPRGVWLKTSHSFGLGAINAAIGRGRRLRVDDRKYENILRNMVFAGSMPEQEASEFWRYFGGDMVALTRYGRNALAGDVKALEPIAAHHGLSMIPQAIALAWEAIEKGRKEFQTVDYCDMVYLPVHAKLRVPNFSHVFVDECQDLSPAQCELAGMAIGTGRGIFVGDRHQAIFGFAGAGTDSVDRIIERFKPEILPLPMTYRCGNAIVDKANEVLTGKGVSVKLEAAPMNPAGVVDSLDMEKFYAGVKNGDMVLCRVARFLVAPCFALIRKGIKATIRGRDIGKQLAHMVERWDAGSLSATLAAIQAYGDGEVSKLSAGGRTAQAVAMEDRVETIYALADGCGTVAELLRKIDGVFSDEVTGVVFSTVHKAKGLEARNVYILEPRLFPHPMAKSDWEKEQEVNLEYVAYTRAIERLMLVPLDQRRR